MHFGDEQRSGIISIARLSVYEIVPLDEIYLFFVWVHAFHMLLEVVQTWPNLFLVSAILRSTLIRFDGQTDPVNALLVSIEVIYGREASTGPLAIYIIANEWLIVFEHVFSVRPHVSMLDGLVIGTYTHLYSDLHFKTS